MADSNSTGKTLKIIIAVLAIVIAGMVVVFFMTTSKKDQAITQVTTEKDDLTKRLEDLQVTYSVLQTNNDTLSVQLDEERQKIEILLDKVKKTEASNRAQLRKYEDELGTLRAIMRSYVRQIDSLNMLNQELMAENIEVKEAAQQSQQRVAELTERTDQLSSKVEKGAALKARDVMGVGLNSRSKETNRAGRTEKIRVCFTLIENELADMGPRNVFLRVKGPDGIVLTDSEDNLFSYQGNQLIYSAVREIDFQGVDVEMCIFCDIQGEAPKGTYTLTIYSAGALIGSSEVTLK